MEGQGKAVSVWQSSSAVFTLELFKDGDRRSRLSDKRLIYLLYRCVAVE